MMNMTLTTPEHRTGNLPYLVLAGLQVLDVATTGWLLATDPSVSEANPLTGPVLLGAGLFAGLALLLVVKLIAVAGLWLWHNAVVVAVILAVYAAVVVQNLVTIWTGL